MSTESLASAVKMPRSFTHSSDACEVSAKFSATGAVSKVSIVFRGALGRIPSTSNSKAVMMTRYGRPFIAKNEDHQRRLAAMTKAYLDLLLEHSIYPGFLTFGREQVLVIVRLSQLCDNCDTHNMSKPICDWLQAVSVLENDKFADCFCLRSAEALCDPGITRIDIILAAAARESVRTFLKAIGA